MAQRQNRLLRERGRRPPTAGGGTSTGGLRRKYGVKAKRPTPPDPAGFLGGKESDRYKKAHAAYLKALAAYEKAEGQKKGLKKKKAE
jgi:hypothetical protein